MTAERSAVMRRGVETLRRIMKRHVPAACLLLVLTLCMKLAVPVGFMPDLSDGGVRLVVCDGMAVPAEGAHAMPGHHHHGHDASTRSDAPCPFAGLAAPALGGTDPIQLALAVANLLVAGFVVAVAIRLRAVGHLRPPLRGPPFST